MTSYKRVLCVSSGLLPIDKPPAALAFLASICEKNALQYDLFDVNSFIYKHLGSDIWNQAYTVLPILNDSGNQSLYAKVNEAIDLAVEKILSYNYDLLVVTMFSYYQELITNLLLKKIKKQSTATIIIGGPGVSYIKEDNKTIGKDLLSKGLVDFYVLGEGENVLNEFFRSNHVLGLNSKGYPTETWATQIDDLNICPIPTYKKINFNDYYPGFAKEHIISVTGSRGCVRRCTFCDVGSIWKKFRFRNAENIVAEILQHVAETGVTNFMFTDSLINGSIKQFMDFISKLADLKSKNKIDKNIKYHGQFIIRPKNQHPEKMYQLMQLSGCDHIQVGIESGSNNVRTHMGKKFSNEDVYYHLEMSSKYKIKNSFLMMSGYPTETLQDHHETMEFLTQCQKYLLDETIINLNLNEPYVLLKNTPIDEMKHQLGIENEHYTTHFFDITTNPESTVNERFRRYIELKKLVMELKYPGSYGELGGLNLHIQNIKKFIQEKKNVN